MPRERRPSQERSDKAPARPLFRQAAEGERKPFKARDKKPFGKSGGSKQHSERGEGKPSSRGKPARGKPGAAPRRPRPGTDKETP
jgi:hypothetical protein